MLVRYFDAECQRKHGRSIKTNVKYLLPCYDEALFKDPPPKEECPICFIPMLIKSICCVTLPPATIFSVPVQPKENCIRWQNLAVQSYRLQMLRLVVFTVRKLGKGLVVFHSTTFADKKESHDIILTKNTLL